MKTIYRVIAGICIVSSYYMMDATLDFLIQNELSLSEIAFTNIPHGELFNRLFGMLLLGSAWVFFLRNRFNTSKAETADKSPDPEEVNSYLNSFAVIEMISAQLKTTMNTVLGFLNLVKEKKVSPHARDVFTEYVYSSSSNLLQLFNYLVELYHLVNNNASKNISRISVNQILTDLSKKYTSELKHRTKSDLNLELHLPSELNELELDTDGGKLTTVLESLLQNAIGFSEGGTINFGYTLVQDKEIRFFFHDSGAGISMEQLEGAFANYLGNPCGMDISSDLSTLRMEVARRFTEMLGGRIWSSTRLGAGSSFYLAIPVTRTIKNTSKEKTDKSQCPDWSGKRILIAEDIDSNYVLLKTLLEASRAEIVWAKNGSEALDLFASSNNSFDAVLMDIVMPVMDGFEAAQGIKKINKAIPIIGQTAYCLDSEEDRNKLKFFDDFLTKPIWKHELLRTLSKFLA